MPRVLIIDDEEMDRRILSTILSGGGYEVIGNARTGEEGVSLYRQLKPDLVTIDLMLPGINGIEVLQHITGMNPTAKVLMCTSSTSDPIIALSKRYGADGYITKPYQAQALLRIVRGVIGDPGTISPLNKKPDPEKR